MPVPLQNFYRESAIRFGRMLKQLRVRRSMSRAQFIMALLANAHDDDAEFWDRQLFVTESWLRNLEEGNVRQIPTWALEPILGALRCSSDDAYQLLDCLIPDVAEFMSPDRAMVSSAGSLTRRELEVLKLGAEGLISREIAEKLVVEKVTVDSHWNNIRVKLRVGSRRQAIASARGRGII